MEVTLELVEQLRQHADVSYEEARAALEHSGGDLLEALIWLERMGKIGGGAAKVGEYHTGPDAPDPRQPGPEAGGAQAQPQAGQDQPERWWSRIWQVLTENRLECSRGDTRFEVPLAVLIAMVLFAFYVVAVALVLGFCFGWRFHFAGPELGSRQVNDVMDQIDDAAEDIRERVRRSWRDRKK